MKIKFLGTNGWYSTNAGSGLCTLVISGPRAIVLDAGDGFHKLSGELEAAGIREADVFLSHLHLDHCEGLHTLPKLPKGTEVRIFVEEGSYGKLKLLLDAPFTAPPDNKVMKADVKIVPFRSGERVEYFTSLPLPHSVPDSGFRFGIEGKTVAYCLDSWPCDNMETLARNADVFITECSWKPGTKVDSGWQHMTPELAAGQAKAAGAKMLVLTHFGPTDYPELSDRAKAEKAARKIFPNTIIARDGEALEL